VAADSAKAGVRPPAVVVIGQVVALRDVLAAPQSGASKLGAIA
jgi:siroheme synthase